MTTKLLDRVNSGVGMLTLMVGLLAYCVTISWWASSIDQKVEMLESSYTLLLQKQDKINEQLTHILVNNSDRLARIETRLEAHLEVNDKR